MRAVWLFPAHSFGLVLFSYNGIDSIDLGGRKQVLQEVYRVLRPGGCFVFSCLNRRDAAMAARWPDLTVFRRAGWSPALWMRATARLLVGGINRLRRAPMLRAGAEIAVGQIPAHNFALVTLFMSVRAAGAGIAGGGVQRGRDPCAGRDAGSGRRLPDNAGRHGITTSRASTDR